MALAAAGLLVGACTPDPEAGTTAPTDAPSTTRSLPSPPEGARIADECPPEPGSPDVPATWPTVFVTTTDRGPVEVDLTEVVDASCFVLAPSYSAALDIPVPELGSASGGEGAVLAYAPADPPADLDDPDAPWWGEDRVRVCTELDGGRQGCTNIDVRTLRPDVADLRDRFEVTTLPQLTSPLTRAGMRDEGVTPAGMARLQDAYAAEWALQLVAQTLDLPQPPLQLAAACQASGNEVDDLLAEGRALLDRMAGLADASTVALTTTMGQEPDPDLSRQANAALAAVGAWIGCEI